MASLKDVDASQIIGLCAAERWVATYNQDERPLLFWVLFRTGILSGVVGETSQGNVLRAVATLADSLDNFTGYRRK